MSVSLPIDIPVWKMKKEVGEENSVDTATVLTGFVREKYLKHLKTLLLKNYTSCSSQQHPLRILTEQDIEKCARDLENEALRDCMVVQLYQKSMSSMVKDIKGHTDLLKLHHILESFTFTSTSKETQTETTTVEKTSFQPLPDLIGKLEMSGGVQCKKEPLEELPRHTTVKQNSIDSLEFDVRKIKKESHLNNIFPTTTTSAFNISMPKESVALNVKEKQTTIQHTSTKLKSPNLEQNLPYQEYNDAHSEPVVSDAEYRSLDERLADLLQEDYTISNVESTLELEEPHSSLTSDFKELDFPYLDERLAEIFGETAELEPEVKRKRYIRKVTSWRSEKETNLRMLNSLMTRFSKTKKQQVERLFFELFEPRRRRKRRRELEVPTSNAKIDPTGSNLVSEKKRLGRRVVHHLMQFYKSGQISSREQFKCTASQITDALMLKNSLPEEREVEESVRNVFKKLS